MRIDKREPSDGSPRHRRTHSRATAGQQRWGAWIAIDAKPARTTAMSAVWRVQRDGDPPDAIFALKTLRYHKGPTSTAYQRFEREIKILGQLRNRAGIVEVVDHSSTESTDEGAVLYYVMPWAETSLERLSKALVGQVERVLTIGSRIADALDAAHAEGIIHRDVKPANV